MTTLSAPGALVTGSPASHAARPVPPVPPAPRPAVVAAAGPAPSGRRRRPRWLTRWWRGLVGQARRSADSGMATAEYAIVTVAAAAFAGLLIAILRSDEVRGLLLGIIRGALSV